jgi:hypothetical protein
MKKKYANRAEQQNAYRERLRETSEEWADAWDGRYPKEAAEVRQFVRDTYSKVVEEFTPNPQRDSYFRPFSVEETVGYVARTLYAYRKDTPVWVRKWSGGDVITAGSHFPDVVGWTIVTGTHENNLESSPTYSALYRELLPILDQQFGHNGDRSSIAVKEELTGKFVLPLEPPMPEIKLEQESKPALATTF